MSGIKKDPLIIIVGPTAAGKTAVSITLAERLNGEIVSADSRQLYRQMDIGTAKPTLTDQIRVPHHLIDVADPDETWSLAIYLQKAYHIIDQIHKKGKLPFLVGGTGQYVRSIVEGWQIPPQRADFSLRQAITEWSDEIGAEALHKRLAVIDPGAAAKIDYQNLRRTVRAIEVIFKTGERFSDLRQKQECRYDPVFIGLHLPRELLYSRIDNRVEMMLEQGLVDEVKGLLETGYADNLPTMSAIGYAEIIRYLQGEISLDEAVTLIKRNTRIYVRRQTNWFKPDDDRITWFDASLSSNLADKMESWIRSQWNDFET